MLPVGGDLDVGYRDVEVGDDVQGGEVEHAETPSDQFIMNGGALSL